MQGVGNLQGLLSELGLLSEQIDITNLFLCTVCWPWAVHDSARL